MTTWNPSDAGAGITFSNGNLTVTAPSSTPQRSVRGTTSKTTGKWYYESTSTGTMGNCLIGIANAAADMTTMALVGSIVVNVATGYNFNNNNLDGPYFTAWAINDVCCIAVDLVHLTIWFRKNNGVWNGTHTPTGDPTNNVGGLDISWLGAGNAAFPMIAFNTTNALSETADFGATSPAYTVPGSFAIWDGSVVSSVFSIHPFV